MKLFTDLVTRRETSSVKLTPGKSHAFQSTHVEFISRIVVHVMFHCEVHEKVLITQGLCQNMMLLPPASSLSAYISPLL